MVPCILEFLQNNEINQLHCLARLFGARRNYSSLADSCLPVLKNLPMHFIVPGFASGKYVLPLAKSHVSNGCLVIARYREWTKPH